MNKQFLIGFFVGVLAFLLINLLSAQLASDCGLPAVFKLDPCFDDIARAGWPFQFYEEGGFVFHFEFKPLLLILDMWIGTAFALGCGWLFSRRKSTLAD